MSPTRAVIAPRSSGTGECECGVCRPDAAGPNGRCLGVPNDCGNVPVEETPAWLVERADHPNSKFCFEGQCDGTQASYGCCLTCF